MVIFFQLFIHNTPKEMNRMIEESSLKRKPKQKHKNLPQAIMLDYYNYLRKRRKATNQKRVLSYRNEKLSFTTKQIEVLSLVAKGFSNSKIAQKLSLKETTAKLLIYRLMKYIEACLCENVDRFSLIIFAQELNLDEKLSIGL